MIDWFVEGISRDAGINSEGEAHIRSLDDNMFISMLPSLLLNLETMHTGLINVA